MNIDQGRRVEGDVNVLVGSEVAGNDGAIDRGSAATAPAGVFAFRERGGLRWLIFLQGLAAWASQRQLRRAACACSTSAG